MWAGGLSKQIALTIYLTKSVSSAGISKTCQPVPTLGSVMGLSLITVYLSMIIILFVNMSFISSWEYNFLLTLLIYQYGEIKFM